MKIRTWIVGIAALAMSGNAAVAQTGATAWSYDNNVKAVGCCEASCGCDDGCCDSCCDDGCCGDACCGDACCGDGVGCGSGICGSGIGAGLAGFTLAGLVGLDDSGLDFGGWTQIGWHDNNTPLSQAFDDTLAFNDLPDQVNLHQQWFYLGKAADGSNGLDWGFRADVMYGTDAQKTQAFGNPGAGTRGFGTFDASLDHGEYGWAIPQLYGELAMGDFSVIVGHFYTL
ncbi:MAG: outer membrane beta-barrel protein, partial [Lacipirellulaceae bacterium]